MSKLGDEMIKVAGSQIGVHEATGHNDGTDVEKYLKSTGLPEGYAWCMAFVFWCASQAAKNLGQVNPLKQTAGVLDQWQSKHGTHLSEPEQGAVFILQEAGGGYHTGIITGVLPDGVLHTIEGNTNDNGSREGVAVMRKDRNTKQMIGYIRLEDKVA